MAISHSISPKQRDLFWRRVYKSDGCWDWLGTISVKGYGVLSVGGRQLKAHRVAYELVKGVIPDGLTLDHLCRNRKCVRPDHLEAVTAVENVMRGIGFAPANASKTHCSKGHPLSGENVRVYGSGPRKGKRVCLTCQRALDLAHKKAARKAAPRPTPHVGPKLCSCGRMFETERQWRGHMRSH